MWFLSRRKARHTPPSRAPRRASHPRLEALEDRCVLSGGVLDPTFGSGGLVTSSIGNSAGAEAVVTQPDGKIVVGGNSRLSASVSYEFTIARYNADGTLDNSFGNNGIVQTVVGKNGSYIAGLALQSDGKIVAVGHASLNFNTYAFAVVRYNRDGSLDTTFGGGGHSTGIVLTSAGNGANTNGANAVAIDGSGRIDVAGTSIPSKSSLQDFTLVRYNANGTLDTTFGPGKDGTVTTQIGNYGSQASALAIQTDGKIVVTGTSHGSNVAGIGVVRYTATGQPDTSFGTGGVVSNLLPPGATSSWAASVLALSSGLIMIDGGSTFPISTGNVNDLTLVRFTSNGQPDTAFGSSGFAFDSAMSGGAGLAQEANGGLLAAGDMQVLDPNTGIRGFGVAAFQSGGALDPSFGNNGTATAAFGGGDNANAMAIQGDGRIVVAGFSSTASSGYYDFFALARFLPSGPQIGWFSASPNPVTSGSNLTLTASNITDGNPSSSITQVSFYYFDSSGNKVTLATATQGSGGTWSVPVTVTLPAGGYTIYAQAEDNYGVFSDPFALTLTVQ